MNLENFAEYLKYPSRLYQLPYEELKSLTMQYPYCANFHVLLLIKSKLEGHPDLEKNLARAATYSVDRQQLRRIMLEEELVPAESQITIGEDEVLELKDLFTLDENWEKLPVDQSESTQETTSAHLAFSFPGEPRNEEPEREPAPLEMENGENSEEEITETPPTESFTENKEVFASPETLAIVPEDVEDHSEVGIPDAAASTKAFQISEDLIAGLGTAIGITQAWSPPLRKPAVTESTKWLLPAGLIEDCAAVSSIVQDWWETRENTAVLEWEVPATKAKPVPASAFKKPPTPTPKSKFQSYKKRYRRPLAKDIPPPPPPPVREEPIVPGAKKVAEESLREDLEVASETLAGILVQQHQYTRAIKMYEHLSLLIPEKNTYFAAKIDAIKKL